MDYGVCQANPINEPNQDLIRDFILGHCAGVGEPLDPLFVRACDCSTSLRV